MSEYDTPDDWFEEIPVEYPGREWDDLTFHRTTTAQRVLELFANDVRPRAHDWSDLELWLGVHTSKGTRLLYRFPPDEVLSRYVKGGEHALFIFHKGTAAEEWGESDASQ